MQFGPHLFEEEYPEFGAIGPCKCDLVALAWEQVVCGDNHFYSVFVHSDSVHSLLVDFVRDEHLANATFDFGQGSD